MQYKSVVKKRSVAQILTTVQRKLRRLLSEVTEHSPDAIERALSNPDAEKVLQRRITEGSIQLVDSETKSPVFTRQMSKIGERGYLAAIESPGASEMGSSRAEIDVEPEEAELVSAHYSRALHAVLLLFLTNCLLFVPM